MHDATARRRATTSHEGNSNQKPRRAMGPRRATKPRRCPATREPWRAREPRRGPATTSQSLSESYDGQNDAGYKPPPDEHTHAALQRSTRAIVSRHRRPRMHAGRPAASHQRSRCRASALTAGRPEKRAARALSLRPGTNRRCRASALTAGRPEPRAARALSPCDHRHESTVLCVRPGAGRRGLMCAQELPAREYALAAGSDARYDESRIDDLRYDDA